MRTTITKATAITITAIMLNACGGGGGGDTASTTGTVDNGGDFNSNLTVSNLCIRYDNPNSFSCKTECNTTSEAQIATYYDDANACTEHGTNWIVEYNKNDVPFSQEQQDGFDYLNTIRIAMGIAPLKYDTRLEASTKVHEWYIGDVFDTYNRVIISHWEDNNTYPSDYYTGVNVWDRAEYQGFNGTATEVGSTSSVIAIEAMKGLMTAIYHRNAMIDTYFYRIGVGGFDNPFSFNFTFATLGQEYDKNNFIDGITVKVATYPYGNQTNVQRSFDNTEIPDPLPDYSWGTLVGNPLSVYLNPSKVTNPQLVSFKLFIDATNTEVANTRVITADNDPVSYFTAYQFALFPLDVLNSNTTYRAEFEYLNGGNLESKVWSFTTEN